MYGLKSSEVEKQREKYGSNKLPDKKLKTGFQFFMETFESHINQILLAMMIVFTVIAVFGQGSYSEPIGVAVVLLAIALLGMNTGLKSQKSAKELKDRTSVHYCNVIRNGKIEHINTNDLVVGDLVIIQSGEAIHADGYLVEGNIKVDNSVLNGESEPCKKTAWDKEDSPITFGGQRKADSSDYTNSYALFSGTTVTDGEGKMIVTNVGVDTVNGQTISTIDEVRIYWSFNHCCSTGYHKYYSVWWRCRIFWNGLDWYFEEYSYHCSNCAYHYCCSSSRRTSAYY